jgi:rhomboid protease GluP
MEECKFKATPTLVLIAANVAMYVYMSLLSGNFVAMSDDVLRVYGQLNSAVFNGAYWQLVSAMFVHFDIVHIASNMLFLFIFGLRAEELFSTTEYYLIYFSSGLAGNLLTLLAGPILLSAGASGAIMGVFGANVIFMRRTVGQPVFVSLMFAFMFFVLTASEGTNLLAHFGGLVAGLLLGYAFAGTRRFVRRKSKYAS